MRDRRKLEPISIDELANDSTMTGFSDLFKIPTEIKKPAIVVPRRLSRAKEVIVNSSLLSRVESIPTETTPPVSPPSGSGQREAGQAKNNEGNAELFSKNSETAAARKSRSFEGSATTKVIPENWRETTPLVTTRPVITPAETGPLVISPPVYRNGAPDGNSLAASHTIESKEDSGRYALINDEAGQPLPSSISQSVSGPLTSDPSETGGSVKDGSVPVWNCAPLPRKLQIREAKLVQEGHTYGEQTVYDALWKNGNPVTETVRLITIGFLRMANLVGLAESNCKIAIAGLLDKLAIERLPDSNIAQGRTYKIYGWSAILSRRRSAGLTHVLKSRGVIFVDPKTGLPLTSAKTQPRKKPGTSGIETGPPVSRTETQNGRFQSVIKELASRLRQDLDSSFDDSAAARLWRECQSSIADCTIEEVVHFASLKAQKIYKDRNIRNPIGLLLMTVPEFFTGSAVKEFRVQQGREAEQQREFQMKQREYWRRVAEDPNTPLDEREMATKFLAELL
jgi:hypothetical protein